MREKPSFEEFSLLRKGENLRPEWREFLERFSDHVIYEDDDVLAINKPAHIASHSGPRQPYGIVELVHRLSGYADTELAHRLDRDTSGLLLLAKNREALSGLMRQFQDRSVEKSYLALVDRGWNQAIAGIIAPITKEGEGRKNKRHIEISNRARKAATAFHEIARFSDDHSRGRSLLRIRIFTGRTHQIRAHLEYLEYPITGDRLYNPDKLGFKRQLLHSFEMTINHPRTGERMTLRAPLTEDFQQFLATHTPIEKEDVYDSLVQTRGKDRSDIAESA